MIGNVPHWRCSDGNVFDGHSSLHLYIQSLSKNITDHSTEISAKVGFKLNAVIRPKVNDFFSLVEL